MRLFALECKFARFPSCMVPIPLGGVKDNPPFRRRARRAAREPADGPRRQAVSRQKYDPRPLAQTDGVSN
jgi:hypothetical protein